MKAYFLVSFLFLFSNIRAWVILPDSIPKDTAAKEERHRKFKMAIDYSSENTFKGRKDTANTTILSPFLKYTAKSGFFLQASLVNVPTAQRKKFFDELDAGLGWMFDFSAQWDGMISYTHYFFDSQVARIKATVQNDLNATVGFDWDISYLRAVIDYNSGNPNFTTSKGKNISKRARDFSVTVANSHEFYFDFIHHQNLSIIPEADVLFGTQNFLAAYKGKTDPVYQTYQKQASGFNLTAYILYLTVSYQIKKITFMLDPSYTIPQNVPQGESSTPYFVMSGSIYVAFKSKNKNKK